MPPTLPIVDLFYAATVGEADWSQAMSALHEAVGAATSSLYVSPDIKAPPETLYAPFFSDAQRLAYALYYHHQDPWLQRFQPAVLAGGAPLEAVRAESVVDLPTYRRSEFYNDHARRVGVEWMIAGLGRLGGRRTFQVALHRPPGQEPFTERELLLLQDVLPHMRRALQIRDRLQAAPGAIGSLALEALAIPALVVDADLVLRHANAAAIRFCRPASGLRLVREGARPGAPLRLRPATPAETARLTVLARGVALQGGSGGAARLLPGPSLRRMPVAVLVAPLPGGVLGSEAALPGTARGLALLLMRPIERAVPPVSLLQDLFDLTLAEAEVASGMAGGTGVDALAARRGVSPATIRAQVRAVLQKTGATGLRELEALLASLPHAAPAPPVGEEDGADAQSSASRA